jgi:hypothetical protein
MFLGNGLSLLSHIPFAGNHFFVPAAEVNLVGRGWANGADFNGHVLAEPLPHIGVQLVQRDLAKYAGLLLVLGIDQDVASERSDVISGHGLHPWASVRLFELDDERVSTAVVENLDPAFPTHFEQGLIELLGLLLACDHRQELLVGQN